MNFKIQITLFCYGLMDSLKLVEAYKYFTKDPIEGPKMKNTLYQSIKFSAQQLCLIIVIDLIAKGLSWLNVPQVLLYIIYPFILLFFMENSVRQLVYIGQICNMIVKQIQSLSAKENTSQQDQQLFRRFLTYELAEQDKKSFKSIVDQMKLTVQALLFSFILLIQTSLIDILVILFPSIPIFSTVLLHIDYLLYAVYISVGHLSLKIPYKDHLPFYFHQYIGYLVGYSILLSYFLNLFFSFPKLGLVFSIFSPICMLRLFEVDPPSLKQIKENNLKENLQMVFTDFLGETQIDRSSYEQHLKEYHNNQSSVYKTKSRRTIGWFTLAKGIRPYVILPLNRILQTLIKIYNSLTGGNFQ